MNYDRKRQLLIFLAILALGSAVYLNRAYSYIYSSLGSAGLERLDNRGPYIINDKVMATSTLRYAALGDSLTAGMGVSAHDETLPYLLATRLSGNDQRVLLDNYGVSGITTAELITSALPEAIKSSPDMITVMIGVNDIHNLVSAEQFSKNYEEILSRLTKETKAKIYVISIPFIGSDKLMLPPYQALFDVRTREFNEIIKEQSVKYSVKYIDLYSPTVALFKTAGNHYSKDLFHPSAYGYKLWANIIYDNIHQ